MSNSLLSHYGIKSSEPGIGTNVYHLHCAISTQNTETIINVEDEEEEVLGFDRLREIGFSDDDIREARRYFYAVRRATLRGTESRTELLQLEEEFLGSVPEGHHQQISQQSDSEASLELLGGMIMGFLLGFLMFLVLAENTGISAKRRWGAIVGIGCNLSFCLLKLVVL